MRYVIKTPALVRGTRTRGGAVSCATNQGGGDGGVRNRLLVLCLMCGLTTATKEIA